MGKKDDPSRNRRPDALWKEQDMIDGRTVEAMVLILRTSGCRWFHEDGCLMCGYNTTKERKVGIEELKAQLDFALQKYDGEGMVKIYTSGSFLDPEEIPAALRNEVFEAFTDSERVLVESRPEFIVEENLEGMDLERMQIATGLESANDDIRDACVNKGFSFADYERAALFMRERGIPLRTYLLLKPPFLTEREAMRDTMDSVERTIPYSESVSINPVNVQRDTLVERLWKRGEYRSPWWWTLLEVLRHGSKIGGSRIMSAPSGAGSPRGIHNCGKCEDKFIEAVRRFSFKQDPKVLDDLQCDCKAEWMALMNVQDYMRTSVDVSRYLGND